MSRVLLFALPLVFVAQTSRAADADADLPPGAVARLGDHRFRAGEAVQQIVLSPDGRQFATVQHAGTGYLVLKLWDATTGRPVREQKVNSELFKGFVWGERGAFAVALRADPKQNGKNAKLHPDDFRVWDFTDPKAAPPLLPVLRGWDHGGLVVAEREDGGPEFTDFRFSADGKRVAARGQVGDSKYGVYVFELKPADSATKLTRVGLIDLGAEGAAEVRLSADGRTLFVLRSLVNPNERTVTAWDVATGKPGKPVRVSADERLIAPDSRSILGGGYDKETDTWGFRLTDLGTGKQRKLGRWTKPDPPPEGFENEPDKHYPLSQDQAPFAFDAGGRMAVLSDPWKIYAIDLAGDKGRTELKGHVGAPLAIAVSADGSRIATADLLGLIRLWDAKTLRPLHDAPGHRAQVRFAELSPDGKRLLTYALDDTLRLWDLTTGKELRAFTGVRNHVGQFAQWPRFTPDGTAVLYNGGRKLVARDLQTGLEVPLPGELGELRHGLVAFAPDGKAVAIWNGLLTVYDWPSGKKRFEVQASMPAEPGFSPDSTAVFAEAESGERWDAKTGKPLAVIWGAGNGATQTWGIRPHPRPVVVRLNEEEKPSLFAPGTDKPIPGARLADYEIELETEYYPGWNVSFSPDHRQFALPLTWFGKDEIRIYESASGKVRRTIPTAPRTDAYLLGITPDGTKLLTAGCDHTVTVWEMRLGHVPLPEALKKETDAAKLWNALASDKADAAYLAMARLAREPDAAVKMARLKLKPAANGERETEGVILADGRAIELLEALDTADARALLKELAGGDAGAFRTQEAKRVLERNKK